MNQDQAREMFELAIRSTHNFTPGFLRRNCDKYEIDVMEAAWQGFILGRTPPPGYALVPVEPTEAMFVDGMEADCLGRPSVDDETHVLSIWHAMLAAAQKEIK